MKANPVIGRCPCPVKGCSLLMAVKRIQPRTDQPGRQRKAGLLYGDCADHGRFGFDGAPAMQTYIEDHSTKCDESEGSASAPPAPATEVELPPSPPATKPAPAAPKQRPNHPASAQPAPLPPPPASAPTKARGLLDW